MCPAFKWLLSIIAGKHRWHIVMSSASGSEGPWFKYWRQKIYGIRNDTESLSFKYSQFCSCIWSGHMEEYSGYGHDLNTELVKVRYLEIQKGSYF